MSFGKNTSQSVGAAGAPYCEVCKLSFKTDQVFYYVISWWSDLTLHCTIVFTWSAICTFQLANQCQQHFIFGVMTDNEFHRWISLSQTVTPVKGALNSIVALVTSTLELCVTVPALSWLVCCVGEWDSVVGSCDLSRVQVMQSARWQYLVLASVSASTGSCIASISPGY